MNQRAAIGRGCEHCGDAQAETRFGMCFPCFDGRGKATPAERALVRKMQGARLSDDVVTTDIDTLERLHGPRG